MTTFVLDTDLTASSFELIQLFNDEEFRTSEGGLFTSGRNGNRWELVLNWNNMVHANRRALWATIVGLNGKKHRLRVYPYRHFGYEFSGVGPGVSPNNVIRLQGAHTAGATQLTVDGMDNNVTDWIRAGDFIRILNEMKMVTADVDTNGSGEGTFEIWPELHADQNDNQIVVYNADDIYADYFLVEAQGLGATPYYSQSSNSKWLSTVTVRLEEDVTA